MHEHGNNDELVRCLSCHAVYEKPRDRRDGDRGAACPDCGGSAWLALQIPLPDEAAAPAPAH